MAESSPDSCLKGGKFSAPGFRFHPTDEELVMYYLKRKICGKKLRVNVIGVVDVYKVDPTDLPHQSLLKTGDRQWFYFTPRSRRYPNAARSGRGTATGYWKATGKDRIIAYKSRSVGLKKTLVFYRGRAPNGERTDWVMHEYTMDEEELGRCKNTKDYYALYKLFKKSGAGPKNGEEYGAPFEEEEWVDDNEDGNDVAVPEEPVIRYEDTRRVDDNQLFNPVNFQLDDGEELFRGIPDALEVPQRCTNGVASSIPQVNSEEELHSTLVNNSARDFLNPQDIGEFFPNGQPHNRPSSFDLVEATEVNSVPNASGMTPLVFETDDYIEVDDLLFPELGASAIEQPEQFWNDLFYDVSMSFDIEPTYQGTSIDPSSLSNFANTSDQNQQFDYQQFQDQNPENQVNNIMDPSYLNQFTDDLWCQDDDQADHSDQPQSISGAFASPPSGVMPSSSNLTMTVNDQDREGENGGGTSRFSSALCGASISLPSGAVLPTSTNHTTTVNAQDQEGENGGGMSPFSSALWAFMDSIPSAPALACEGPLNQTFVRMSSFSRLRFSGKANETPVSTTIAKKPSRHRGFIILSIVVPLCAFWVFIATNRGSERSVLS